MTTSITTYTTKQLRPAIKAYATSGRAFQAESHKLACSVLKHLGKTKDIRVTLQFLQAVPEAVRLNALKGWLEAFGPIRFATPEELKQGAPAAVFVPGKATLLGDAMDKPFWKFAATEGKPYEALDMQKFVEQAVKKLRKDMQETGVDHKRMIAAIEAASAPATAH